MTDIDKIYSMLDAKNSNEIIEKGKVEARKIEDLSLLIMPLVREFVWEACADVLAEKTDEELEPYIPKLLEWLNDLNWPGACTILERLRIFSPQKLKPYFVELFYKLIVSDDFSDLSWVENLLMLLEENPEFKKILNTDSFEKDRKQFEDKYARHIENKWIEFKQWCDFQSRGDETVDGSEIDNQ